MGPPRVGWPEGLVPRDTGVQEGWQLAAGLQLKGVEGTAWQGSGWQEEVTQQAGLQELNTQGGGWQGAGMQGTDWQVLRM